MSGLSDFLSSSLKNAKALARDSVSAALDSAVIDTAVIEYDESGRAVVRLDEDASCHSPPPTQPAARTAFETPGSATHTHNGSVAPSSAATEAEDERRIAMLLEEREELRRQTEEQLARLQDQMAERLQAADARALDCERQAQLRVSDLEAQLRDSAAAQGLAKEQCSRLEAELDAAQQLRQGSDATPTPTQAAAAALAVAAAVDAEAQRWRSEVSALEAALEKAKLEKAALEKAKLEGAGAPAQPELGGDDDAKRASETMASELAQALAELKTARGDSELASAARDAALLEIAELKQQV